MQAVAESKRAFRNGKENRSKNLAAAKACFQRHPDQVVSQSRERERNPMDFDQRPGDDECFGYHRDYVAIVPDGPILSTLKDQLQAIPAFIAEIPEDQFLVVHPPYGWTVQKVLEHCCDAERVFGYRILRFATGDKTELPGWDENHYAACGYGSNASGQALSDELVALRQANFALLKRLRPEAWQEQGTADGRKVSVRAIAWLMAGHWLHHERILRTRLASAQSALPSIEA